jgi:hypothetical protein
MESESVYTCACLTWARTPEMGEDILGHHPRCGSNDPVTLFSGSEIARLRALLTERDAEVARLRAALAYYAEPREYNRVGGDPVGAEPPIMWDRGFRARAALVGGEGG